MCGRYASSRRPEDLVGYFEVDEIHDDEAAAPAPSYNVAPTDPVYGVVVRDDVRQLRVFRWGLVPSWATDPKVGSRFINARQESVADKPAFRAAYRRRRALLPADGYFEWKAEGKRKQPWYLTSRDGSPLAMAGLYEVWRGPDDAWLWTATIITTSAPDDVGDLHDRAPLLVARPDWERWLDPAVPDPDALLVPGVPGVLDAWPVSSAVGNVRNNGPELVVPLT